MHRFSRLAPVAHGAAATVALVTIALFWTATVASEIAGDPVQIWRVKRGIAWGLFLLVPALAATGASGRALAGPSPRGLPGKKYRRMKVIAALGLLVLAPAALLLARWAGAGQFGPAFYLVQVVELVAGAVNFALLGMSFRDGLRLRGARRRALRRDLARATPGASAA